MVPSESLSHRGDQAAEISWESSAPGDTDLQVHVARNSQKLIQVESGLSVVNGRLDEWSKVTLDLQACLMDMQASQSFCRLASWMSSITNPMQTGGTPSTAASELSDETSLSHRCLSNVFQNIPGAQAQETHFSDLVVVLERAAANCESRMAARCAAVEAVCQELRCSLQELRSASEGGLHQLQEGLHDAYHQAEMQSTKAFCSLSQRLDALESAGTDMMQQLSKLEAGINAKINHPSEMAIVRDCVTTAMARCENHLSEMEVLLAQHPQEVAKQANSNTVAGQTKRSEESNSEAGRDLACVQVELEMQLHQQQGELRSLREFVEKSVALQKKTLAVLRNAASTAGTGSAKVAVLAQQLSVVQEEQKAVANVVKFVAESVAEAAAASIRCAGDNMSASLSTKHREASTAPAATSFFASCAPRLSHLQDTELARASMEDLNTPVLTLEKAVCSNVDTPPSLQKNEAGAFAGSASGTAVTTVPPVCPSFQTMPALRHAAVPKISAFEHAAARQTIQAWRSSPSAVVQEDIYAKSSVKRPEDGTSEEHVAARQAFEAGTVVQDVSSRGQGPEVVQVQGPTAAAWIRRLPLSARASATVSPATVRILAQQQGFLSQRD